MKRLQIFDVSACVHTGNSADYFYDRMSYGVPVGGIHYLMRQICNAYNNGDDFILCFDSPSKKGCSIAGYKSGRIAKPSVYAQLELLYERLPVCKICCEKYYGYEADDIIAWAVEQHKASYDEIQIVGNDHDLVHSVQDRVWFRSICPSSGPVYRSGFEETADSTYTMFNTISAKKVLVGCKSDSIPSITLQNGMRGKELYELFCKFIRICKIKVSYESTTNPELLRIFAKYSKCFTEKDLQLLDSRIDLVYPSTCPEEIIIQVNNSSSLSLAEMFRFLSMVNDWESLNSLGTKCNFPLLEEEKAILYNLARKLKSGEYAAEKNIPHSSTTPVLKSMSFDLFEREV